MKDALKVAAVVVTYNRLSLLKECVNSLRMQTRALDRIIIINNSSTDGTAEWLSGQKDLTVITQPNSGSAGGQHTGIKAAYEYGYDWIWCMDDDGKADYRCLESLLSAADQKNIGLISPLVKENENSATTTFHIEVTVNGSFYVDNRISSFTPFLNNGILYGYAALFLGTLISRDTVKRVGLPIRYLFISGEETEYYRRMVHLNVTTATNFNALFFHPKSQFESQAWIFNRYVLTNEYCWKNYYYFRNRAIMAKRYNPLLDLKYFISQATYYLIYFRLKDLFLFLKAWFEGMSVNLKKLYSQENISV